MSEHYRVIVDTPMENACDHCGHGKMWTIVSGPDGDETQVSTSWGDKELADDICDFMNMAFDAGSEVVSALEPRADAETRALFNEALGVHLGRKFSFSFETEEKANRAFHYITQLGALETSQPPTGDRNG